jgi:hypothetical protein
MIQTRSQAFNSFLYNVEDKHKKRAAKAHYFDTRVRLMFKAWRVGSKLDRALAWWMDNTLKSELIALAWWMDNTLKSELIALPGGWTTH